MNPSEIKPSKEDTLIIKKYAAIDIGSNAMRLLISYIVEQEGKEAQFNKNSLVRVPIRLGQDSFTVGEISDENIDRMIDAMQAFRLLMKIHKVEQYKALATSAMREAYNGKEVVEIIKEKAGIEKVDGSGPGRQSGRRRDICRPDKIQHGRCRRCDR